MRKIAIVIYAISFLLISCHTKTKKATKQIDINTSINKSNAYNDLFLDSNSLNKFYAENNITEDDADAINNFYYSRNFEYAWFASDGLSEQARSLWNLLTYTKSVTKDTTLYNKSLRKQMAALIINDSLTVAQNDTAILKTELLLTKYYIDYLQRSAAENSMNTAFYAIYVPAEKTELLQKAADVLKYNADKKNDDASQNAYYNLSKQLQKYYSLAQNKGWQNIPLSHKTFHNGSTDAAIILIKKRLSATGELNAADTSNIFDTTLANAVKVYQQSLGYTPTGKVDDSLISDMNVSVSKRLQQILINMNRMKWMPSEDSGKLIMCNIPEYKIYVYEDGKQIFNMATVVGKDGHNTVIFTGNLDEIVFSPYWNIPPSIVKKEMLPKLAENKKYYKENDIEQVGTSDGLPVLRQKPGAKNSLGKVKFLFPNDFNIYFHDTPVKSLFAKDKRAYSHGCIRLQDPQKMAEYLLKDDKNWTPAKITAAMNAGKELHVNLRKSVPVLISYYTAWVDDAGMLNFRDDIYGHDSTMAAKMFLHPAN